jgi:hypothetical protein
MSPTNTQWDAFTLENPPGCPPYCEHTDECKGDGECALKECGPDCGGEGEVEVREEC